MGFFIRHSGDGYKVASERIGVKIENAQLTSIFNELEKTTDYRFSYGQEVINDEHTYSVDYQNAEQAISDLDEETLYNEISYENYWEGKRRPQMIRFGTFDNAYAAKAASEPYRRLYPIPQDVIDVSGDIFSQNEGYDGE